MGKTLNMLIGGIGLIGIGHGTYNLRVFDIYEIKPASSIGWEQVEKHLDALPAAVELWGGVFVLAYSLIKLKKQS